MASQFRYRRLGYVALNVTDMDKTMNFATNVFALSPCGEGPNGERFLRCSTKHHDLMLIPAEEPGFVRASWELETEEDMQKAFAHFDQLGLDPVWLEKEVAAVLGLGFCPVFRVIEPTSGACFEYFSKMEVGVNESNANRTTKFKELGHFGLAVPHCKESVTYLQENFGFVGSDYVGDYMVSLLRAWPNPNHHSYAPLQSPFGKSIFHHVAFMVEEIDDIGKLFNRIKDHNVQSAFGIGRHPTSGSIHLYIYDPDDMVWEYTLGMEQFPEENAREPRFMSMAPENFDLWGAKPDPGFLQKGKPVISDLGL